MNKNNEIILNFQVLNTRKKRLEQILDRINSRLLYSNPENTLFLLRRHKKINEERLKVEKYIMDVVKKIMYDNSQRKFQSIQTVSKLILEGLQNEIRYHGR